MPAHVYPAINLVGYRLSVSALHKKKLKRYTTAGIWLVVTGTYFKQAAGRT